MQAALKRFGLADRAGYIVGRFNESLPTAPVQRLAVLRTDADSFEGTRDALEGMYGRLSPGGVVIIDDYHLPGAREAVHAFRAARGISEPLLPAPLDYVLGCELTAARAEALADDAIRGRLPGRVLLKSMQPAQNVYWFKGLDEAVDAPRLQVEDELAGGGNVFWRG